MEPGYRSRAAAKKELLSRLARIDPYEFQVLIARVLDSVGFRNTEVVGRSGHEGVDIIAYLYSPILSAKVAVQVKRRGSNVGPPDISYLRDRWANRADRLLFISTSDFTQGAREVASDDRQKSVELVNGDQLAELMLEHNLGVRSVPRVNYELDDEFLAGLY